MLRSAVERKLLAEHRESDYVFPAYDDYCFANVSRTALSVLDSSFDAGLPDDVFDGVACDAENVVVLLVDGFGYEQWKRDYDAHPLLSTFTERGRVTPLTSVFPSETAAAMTTNHTGRHPVEHGLLGWYQYYQEFEGVVQTLPFSTRADERAENVFDDADPELLFAGDSLYSRAEQAGIDTYLVQPAHTFDGGYSEMTLGSATPVPYDNVPEMAMKIRHTLESTDEPTFVFAYVPTIDAVSHAAGTDSEAYQTQLAMVTESVRREVVEKLDPDIADETLLVATADHGHIDTTDNVDISEFDPIWDNLRRNSDGGPIPPVGSARNVQLHLKEGMVESVRDAVESAFDVRTFTREEATSRNLFGHRSPSKRFEKQCPDLVAVHREKGMWWDESELDLIGMHGGLSREEMLIPFAVGNVATLQSSHSLRPDFGTSR
ncbi:alkaline phosphatase family protein [Haladaptatus cibarius]|uniref:alkaline phosphatase family protein n=1 Tax=Haladaptatus cibarius TaxID=453847 RepID=UPI0006791736|nr:alkaline phosphatase family protein [Haladaptatus cibarius]